MAPTNRQLALKLSVKTMKGLLPADRRTYTSAELSQSRIKLADIYLEYLEKDEEKS